MPSSQVWGTGRGQFRPFANVRCGRVHIAGSAQPQGPLQCRTSIVPQVGLAVEHPTPAGRPLGAWGQGDLTPFDSQELGAGGAR